KSLFNNKINHSKPNGTKLVQPTELKFELNDSIKRSIQKAQLQFRELVDKHETSVLYFSQYGKDFIKSCKLSPDAYVQMAIQLAYYKMHGVSRPTYESSQTRKFAYGRTETTRSVSVDSIEWVKSMQNPSIDSSKKSELLKKAISSHSKYMADAVEGKGVDRHLLGLKLLASELKIETPKIFTNPAYSMSCHWNVSTSQITSEYYDNWGWGEVCPDGYGIPYMIKEKSIHFCVASQHLHSNRLTHFLQESLEEMKSILIQSNQVDVNLKPKL
ncbi:Acyltransferase ChoActase/COT/CPT domain-containing protein, partial [Rozella allomycis CSF55]